MLLRILLVLSICGAVPSSAMAESASGALRLTLPARMYAVVDLEMNLYFDNVVVTRTPEAWDFDVKCDVGRSESRRWKLTATADDAGSHELTVMIQDRQGKELARKSTQLLVVPSDAGADQNVRLLIVGDSLTHATAYPNEIARLLNRDVYPENNGVHRNTAGYRQIGASIYLWLKWRLSQN